MTAVRGDWELVRELGRGGMGVVWMARHRRTGALAALKTVTAAKAGTLRGLRREIHALASLAHPGIARIVDEGSHEGLPWYAMELVSGVTLRRWRADLSGVAPDGPAATAVTGEPAATAVTAARPGLEAPPVDEAGPAPVGSEPRTGVTGPELARVLTLVRRLCGALAFLHGEGIVHRDLKPDNVLVGPGDLPVLVDFGLVTQAHREEAREALDAISELSGTVAYMSPEQIRGDLVDARADLYALGCVLYELVTGRAPFRGRASAVLAMHLSQAPVPPSRLAAVPPALDRLILDLLAKRAGDRIGHADHVAAALEGLGALREATPAPAPRAYLYRPGLAGRGPVIDGLVARIDAVHRRGAGGVVLLGGESGVGKTRLVLEMAGAARQRGVEVLFGECLPPRPALEPGRDVTTPLAGLRNPLEALVDRCRERGEAWTAQVLGANGPVLAPFVPALRDLPGQRDLPPPAELGPAASRQRLFTAIVEVLTAQGDDLVLVLDDLQWADDLTLGLVELLAATKRLEREPMLVMGTWRTEEAGPHLEALLASEGVATHLLGPLDRAAVGEMVGDMLALTAPPEAFVDFLAERSDGNPFFVAEYLRTAVAEGVLTRGRGGRWELGDGGHIDQERLTELPLPRALRDLVGRRLQGLAPATGAVLAVAAALGREMPEALLAAVSARLGLPSEGPIRELFARQILEPVGGERARFVHDKLREFAYERIEPDRRVAIHREAAAALEAGPGEADFAVVGRHWERAGEPARAGNSYSAAARIAVSRHALRDAEPLLLSALALLDAGSPQALEARMRLACGVLARTGRLAEAREALDLALAEARALGDRAAERHALQELGSVERHLGSPAGALAWFEQAAAIPAGSALAAARLAVDRVVALERLGRLADAEAVLAAAEAEVGAEPAPDVEVLLVGTRASLAQSFGSCAAAIPLWERALELARACGDHTRAVMIVGALAHDLAQIGRLSEAATRAAELLALARSAGDRGAETSALAQHGMIVYQQGRVAEGQASYEAAVKVARACGLREQEALALFDLAQIAAEQGRPEEALGHVVESQRILAARGQPRQLALAGVARARIERRLGRSPAAIRPQLDEAARVLREIGPLQGELAAACELGHLEILEGRPADEALAEAEACLLRSGATEGSYLAAQVAALRGAMAAARDGAPLLRGERPEDVPEPLRRWLAAQPGYNGPP